MEQATQMGGAYITGMLTRVAEEILDGRLTPRLAPHCRVFGPHAQAAVPKKGYELQVGIRKVLPRTPSI